MALVLAGCSQVTMLRTQEMKNVGTDVQVAVLSNLDSSVQYLSAQNDSLRAELEASALMQKRMMAEITTLARRMGDESERNDSRQEEIIYRLDMLLGKSDKILAKKVVVSGAPQAPMSMDSLDKQVYEQMKTGELAENSLYWMALCLIDAKQVDKAKKVLTSLSDAFPDGQKTCSAMFKLASLHGADGEVDQQKQYLQKILNSKKCASSGEFEQAAEILQELLESGPQAEIKSAP